MLAFSSGEKMGTFLARSWAVYDSGGSRISQYDSDNILTEVTTVNSSFDPNEGFTASDTFLATNPLTFRGTIPENGGGLLYVFTDSPSSYYFVYSVNDFSGSGFPGSFNPASISAGAQVFCFAEGTSIATVNGQSAVETLEIGDLIQTESGKAKPVKWIGLQRVHKLFAGPRLLLVCIRADALDSGLPHSDLTVTADHGLLVDGVICHAGALVNGTTITRVPLSEMGETYTVYHVETEAHEIILANGAPAETFIDNVSRRVFDNYAQFEALYGDVPEMDELPYPRAMSTRQVPQAIRARLAGRLCA